MTEKYYIKGSQCISPEGIKAYISGTMSMDDKIIIDEHIKTCPLCANALNTVNAENFSIIQNIQTQASDSIFSKLITKKLIKYSTIFGSSVLLLSVIAIYFSISKNAQQYNPQNIAEINNLSHIENIISNDNNIFEAKNDITIKQNAKELPKIAIPKKQNQTPSIKQDDNKEIIKEKTEKKINLQPDAKNTNKEQSTIQKQIKSIKQTAPPIKIQTLQSTVKVLSKLSANTGKNKKSNNGFSHKLGKKGSDYKNKKNTFTLDEMPQFIGGDYKLKSYITKEINKAEINKEITEPNTGVYSFIVNWKGNIEDVEILKSLTPQVDNKIKTIIKQMPQWEQAAHKGKINVTISVSVK